MDKINSTSKQKGLKCLYSGTSIPDMEVDLRHFARTLRSLIENDSFLLPVEDRWGAYITCSVTLEGWSPVLDRFGAKFLAHGYYRAVFKMGEWVVKCVLHPSFDSLVDSEFKLASAALPENRRHFPEMYKLAEGVVLQRYYCVDEGKYSLWKGSIKALAAEMGCGHDIHDENIGWDSAGEFVFIDFCPDLECVLMSKLRDKVISGESPFRGLA